MTDIAECMRKQGRHDVADELDHLRARVIALEAEIAMLRGTLAQPQPDDEPGVYTFNVPPNAPR